MSVSTGVGQQPATVSRVAPSSRPVRYESGSQEEASSWITPVAFVLSLVGLGMVLGGGRRGRRVVETENPSRPMRLFGELRETLRDLTGARDRRSEDGIWREAPYEVGGVTYGNRPRESMPRIHENPFEVPGEFRSPQPRPVSAPRTRSRPAQSLYINADGSGERPSPYLRDPLVIREQVRALLPERLRQSPDCEMYLDELTRAVTNGIDNNFRNPYLSRGEVRIQWGLYQDLYRQEGLFLRGAAPFRNVVEVLSRYLDDAAPNGWRRNGGANPVRLGSLMREVESRLRRDREGVLERVATAVRRARENDPL